MHVELRIRYVITHVIKTYSTAVVCCVYDAVMYIHVESACSTYVVLQRSPAGSVPVFGLSVLFCSCSVLLGM